MSNFSVGDTVEHIESNRAYKVESIYLYKGTFAGTSKVAPFETRWSLKIRNFRKVNPAQAAQDHDLPRITHKSYDVLTVKTINSGVPTEREVACKPINEDDFDDIMDDYNKDEFVTLEISCGERYHLHRQDLVWTLQHLRQLSFMRDSKAQEGLLTLQKFFQER